MTTAGLQGESYLRSPLQSKKDLRPHIMQMLIPMMPCAETDEQVEKFRQGPRRLAEVRACVCVRAGGETFDA